MATKHQFPAYIALMLMCSIISMLANPILYLGEFKYIIDHHTAIHKCGLYGASKHSPYRSRKKYIDKIYTLLFSISNIALNYSIRLLVNGYYHLCPVAFFICNWILVRYFITIRRYACFQPAFIVIGVLLN